MINSSLIYKGTKVIPLLIFKVLYPYLVNKKRGFETTILFLKTLPFCNRCGKIRSSYAFLILLCYYFFAMPRPPEQPPRTEAPRFPFLLASRFDSRETSQAPYDSIQAIVRER